MKTYKTSSHLSGADGQSIASGSVVKADQLGDEATIKRYADLGVIAEATKDEIAEAEADAVRLGAGSIVTETPAEAEAVADEAAEKSASRQTGTKGR